jgi:hypothetical protein
MNPRDDSVLIPGLRSVPPRPIFVLGLHRSGTTFLCRTLAAAFPLASLTVYHVVHYDRILRNADEGRTESACRELNRKFRAWQMATRGIDDIPLASDMPEEYGWILRRRAGSFQTNPRTAPVLDELCRKLHFLAPQAPAVLLKNPWDSGRAADILKRFPQARFLFLQRDPLAIVNSQFRVARDFSRQKNPFIHMLMRGIPWGRTWLRLQRAAGTILGERGPGRIALRIILRSVTRELARLEASWAVVPRDQRLAFDYEDFTGDLRASLERVAAFLKLPLCFGSQIPGTRRRDSVCFPEVSGAEAQFRRRLKDLGIAQRPLEDVPDPRLGQDPFHRRPPAV